MRGQTITSEAVTKGHPDKLCDQIADGVLDALLAEDPESRCACEAMAWPGHVMIAGEVTSRARVCYEEAARSVIREAGYTDPSWGFSDGAEVTVSIHGQSPDIAMGVDAMGAGDQGIVYGYACDETEERMPLAFTLARRLVRELERLREDGSLPWLRPDGKSQVSVEYDAGGFPLRVAAVVLSAQHDPGIPVEEVRGELREHVIMAAIPGRLLDRDTAVLVNPTGRFVLGGPAADTGLTGRKIVADTYGGAARHGGGALSGKDPTKVDRSAAYALRNMAKTVVAAGAARACEFQAAYAIGVAEPVSLSVRLKGRRMPREDILAWARDSFDLTPEGMAGRFGLRRPMYRATAASGAFGEECPERPWERLDEEALDRLRWKLLAL